MTAEEHIKKAIKKLHKKMNKTPGGSQKIYYLMQAIGLLSKASKNVTLAECEDGKKK